nr:glycosyltransferase family 39 protein [Gordonia aichiensis]
MTSETDVGEAKSQRRARKAVVESRATRRGGSAGRATSSPERTTGSSADSAAESSDRRIVESPGGRAGASKESRVETAERSRHDDSLPYWVSAVGVFIAIRIVGLLVLGRFAQLRETSVGNALSAWDGKWMLAIAEHGYGDVPYSLTDARGLHTADTAYAFFPGYPYLVGWIAKLPLVTPFGAAISLNVVLGCLTAVGAARLGADCVRAMGTRSPLTRGTAVDPERVGLYLVAILAATPMSVVLNMAYTEALFCALTVWALVGVLERNWMLAGIAACLAGTVRPTAVVIIGVVMLAAAMTLVRDRDARSWRSRHGSGAYLWLALVLSPLGYLGYLAVVWAHTGSPTGWFRIQTEGWDTRIDGGVVTFNFVNDALVNSGEVASVATAWIIITTLVMVVVAFWSRLPWPVLLYGTLIVASIVLSSGLMISRPRLLLPAFVLLLPLAIALARQKTSVAMAVVVPMVIGSAWFGAHMLTVYPHAM